MLGPIQDLWHEALWAWISAWRVQCAGDLLAGRKWPELFSSLASGEFQYFDMSAFLRFLVNCMVLLQLPFFVTLLIALQ